MSVESVKPRINPNYNIVKPQNGGNKTSNVSFQGLNPVVALMDVIEAGGYPASFIIQDGLGFIFPRVRHGLLNGGKEKKDENGNIVLGKDGKPEHELNWAYARKEGIREIVTGPSAFIIPYFLLKQIKKRFGSMNDVRLDYIDGFKNLFAKYAQNNVNAIKEGSATKQEFFKDVYKTVIEQSINTHLPEAEKMTKAEVLETAQDLAKRQIDIEDLGKTYKGKALKEKIKGLGGSVEDAYMKLRKSKIGGKVNELAIEIPSSDGSAIKSGNIGELTKAMENYFDDAVKSLSKALKKDPSTKIDEFLTHLTKHKMGTRFFTNLGLFFSVALFYTQIPKLYNMGLKEDPSLGENKDASAVLKQDNNDKNVQKPSFTGNMVGFAEKAGDKVFNGKISKAISDIYELNGPVIEGTAMTTLLYGFCIPPRLMNAQGKYDYKTIFVRDFTAFTALLFGAKALARLFSDGFTKLTGLALNDKNQEGRNVFKKVLDYLNPSNGRHSVLSSKQLESKYMNLKDYRNGVEGFMDFIEQSGGNIQKAFAKDKKVKNLIQEMLGKSYKSATVDEIKNVLKTANKNNTESIKKFYKLFEKENGLLKWAKTCNSTFGFLSTLVLVPSLIVGLTKYCKRMTERDKARDEARMNIIQAQQASLTRSSKPSMAGFLNK